MPTGSDDKKSIDSQRAGRCQQLEDLFLRMSFEMQTNPTPKYGIDRNMLAIRIHMWVLNNRDYVEPALPLIYPATVADAYLDWLYAHPC